MSDFGIIAELTIKAHALRRFVLNLIAALAFLTLATVLLLFVAGPDIDDPDAMRPTIDSVTDLGRTARSEHPTTDPLFGKPYRELCRDIGNGREICR